MKVNVKFLDNLKLEASFDDFSIIADQPIRYKGDGTAPGPYDYFLASSALCAAYFVKVYCKARNIPTDDIFISQNNIVDPENRYNQALKIEIQLPENITDKDRKGMIAAMDRCTVKRVIQNEPEFIIKEKSVLEENTSSPFNETQNTKTKILGKDLPIEETISNMTNLLKDLGINIEIASWRNLVPHVWSVHIRDADSPMCYTNGKGATKDAALASALGEYIERISNNYFYNDYYLGQDIAEGDFVHYPNERWFPIDGDTFHPNLFDEYLLEIYGLNGELKPKHLIDTSSGNIERGLCAIPFTRVSDNKEVFIPVNLIGNLFVSNGMSAGNTIEEAQVQCLSEIFERAVKNRIIKEEMTLPDVPTEVLNRYPKIVEGIKKLEEQGFPIIVKDASLGGKYPVMCVTLMNPKSGGVFASFGAHPKFEVALERSLTELLQGRSFEGMNDVAPPTFNTYAINEHNNIVDHFIDSTGVISWKFFASNSDYDFVDWNINGSTQDELNYLLKILTNMEKEVYIANYNELGACACRILVPNFSEIYEVDDLIWDNHNRALEYRDDILNIHSLNELELKSLVEKLEDSELDDYMPISELIGIAFEEASVWGQLAIGELKGMIYLAINDLEAAKSHFDMLNQFNDNLSSRKKYYQLITALIEIKLNDLDIEDYKSSFSKMFGDELLSSAIENVEGKSAFYGLTKTGKNLSNLIKHKKLIESYKKLIKARSKK